MTRIAVKYVNVDDVIDYCRNLMNKMGGISLAYTQGKNTSCDIIDNSDSYDLKSLNRDLIMQAFIFPAFTTHCNKHCS